MKEGFKHVGNDIYYNEEANRFYKFNVGNNLPTFYSYPNSPLKLTGIYYLYDRLHNKYYIGSSIDICSRVSAHIGKFRNHPWPWDSTMYKASLCHKDRFIDVGVLELCNVADLEELERYYITLADSVRTGWNRTKRTSTVSRNHLL